MMDLFGDERAVSDVLAFIIVFSMIITSVALVYGTGFSSIRDVRDGEQKANAERALEAVALSMDDIVKGQATRRGGSLNLGGGQLRVDDSTDVTVNVDGGTFSTTESIRSFEYYMDDTAVAYESGGVFRRDGSASVAVLRPTMKCTDGSAVVSLVRVKMDDKQSARAIGSTDNVEVSMVEESTELLHSQTESSSFEVVVDVDGTDYGPAWERTLDEQDWTTTDWNGDGDTSEGKCTTKRVVVRLVVIELTYGSP
ncbi:hypothetical protein [Halorubellus sp. PRR65]|uniref:DUF7289 family protein n=1 Tax=Halorubellus sp. PRR65 TaxID=3098148 RepID=UPI002B259B37|nr:hypothetical protein [Halorubellus sp. PRR65]